MEDCTFCKIIAGEVPSTKVYEDENVYAFRDINPAAPIHILVVPKAHLTNILEVDGTNSSIVSHMFEAIPKIVREEEGLADGFRVVNNYGVLAGQTVHHLHFHILGGIPLGKMCSYR